MKWNAQMEQALKPGILTQLYPPPRKVVLVRASRIGDFVCATPAFRALRAALPAAEITLIGLPQAEELAARIPDIDRFVRFPGFPGIAEQFFDARETVAFFQRMHAERFDLAIQMHGSGVFSNPFTLLLGARTTVGFIRPEDPAGRLDAALPFVEGRHEVSQLLALTHFLGAPETGDDLAFPLLPEDMTAAARVLEEVPPPRIAIHAWAREESKQWPQERFAEAAATLLCRYGGTAVLVGSQEARAASEALAAAIRQRLRGHAGCVANLVGQTSLPVLGAVFQRCALLLTNDSGPAHIAYALHTPSVTIFGATRPEQWGPPGTGPHRIVDGKGQVAQVPVADVLAAAAALLASIQPGGAT